MPAALFSIGLSVAGEAASMAAANEGKILVVADVAELAHKPMPARSPAGDCPITATL